MLLYAKDMEMLNDLTCIIGSHYMLLYHSVHMLACRCEVLVVLHLTIAAMVN